MKKNFLQDVVPATQKRSIRDIPLPSHKGGTPKKVSPKVKKQEEPEEILNTPLQATKQEYTDMSEHQEYMEQEQDEEVQEVPVRRRKTSYSKSKGSFTKKITVGIFLGIVLFLGFMLSRLHGFMVSPHVIMIGG
jgi:hypothetical protein